MPSDEEDAPKAPEPSPPPPASTPGESPFERPEIAPDKRGLDDLDIEKRNG